MSVALCLGNTVDDLGYLRFLHFTYGGLRGVDLKAGKTILHPRPHSSGAPHRSDGIGHGCQDYYHHRLQHPGSAMARVARSHTDKDAPKHWVNGEKSWKRCKRLVVDVFFDISPIKAKDLSIYRSCISALRRNGHASLMGGLGDSRVPR